MRWRRRSSDSRRRPRGQSAAAAAPATLPVPARGGVQTGSQAGESGRRECAARPIRPSRSPVLARSRCGFPAGFAASISSTSPPDPRSSSTWKSHRDLPSNARLVGASACVSTMLIYPTNSRAVWTPRSTLAQSGSSARTGIRMHAARFELTWTWLKMSPTAFGRMGTGSTGISRSRRRPVARSCPPWADPCRRRFCSYPLAAWRASVSFLTCPQRVPKPFGPTRPPPPRSLRSASRDGPGWAVRPKGRRAPHANALAQAQVPRRG
jgi:hypothetical protein